MNIKRVTVKPELANSAPNTIYLVKDVDGKVDTYFTGNNASDIFENKKALPNKIYNTFADLVADTTISESTFAYVANATGDPTVSEGYAFYFYNLNTLTWTKISDSSIAGFTIVNGALYFRGNPVGFTAGSYPSYGWPSIDNISFDLVTTAYFQVRLRLASLNGYSTTGLKASFYYKDSINPDDWHLDYEVDIIPGTMEYSNIFNGLNSDNMYAFKVLLTDSDNSVLKVESNVIVRQLLQVDGISDAVFDIVNNTFTHDNILLKNTGLVTNSTIANEDNSYTRSLTFDSSLVNFINYDRVQTTVNYKPRKFDFIKSNFPTLEVRNGDLVNTQEIISVKNNVITNHTVTVTQETSKSIAPSEKFNYTRLLSNNDSLVWSEETVVLDYNYKYNNTSIFLENELNKNYVYFLGGVGATHGYVANLLKIKNGEYASCAASTYYPINTGVSSLRSINTGNRVYLIGGYDEPNSVYYRNMVYLELDDNNNLISTDSGLLVPDSLKGHNVIRIGDNVFIIGGINSTIYKATVNGLGELSEFTTYGISFLPILDAEMVLTPTKLYLIGGRNSSSVSNNKVYSFAVSPSNELSAFVEETPLPVSVYGHRCVNYANYVYMVGGRSSSTVYLSTVYKAPIDETGTIGAWVIDSNLPAARSFGNLFVFDNTLTYTGGYNGSVMYNIYKSPIEGWDYMDNRTVTTQTFTLNPPLTELPDSLHNSGQKIKIYTGNQILTQINDSSMNANKTTISDNISGWIRSDDFPTSISTPNVIMTQTKCYVMPKEDSSVSYANMIYQADIINDSIGVFTPYKKLPFNVPVLAFKIKDRVYVAFLNQTRLVTAPINSDGTLGDFENGPKLLTTLQSGTLYNVFTINARVFITEPNVPGIQTARFGLDGIIESDFTRVDLNPVQTVANQFFTTPTRLYFLNYFTNQLYYSVINTDETFGVVTSAGTIPAVVSGSKIVVTANRVWLFGGWNTSNIAVNKLYSAPINIDGSLGAWTTKTNLPKTTYYGDIAVTGNKIYLFVGFDGTSGTKSNFVYSASFDGWTVTNSSSVLDHEPVLPGIISKTINNEIITEQTEIHIETGKTTSSILETNKYDVVTRIKGDLWLAE